MRHIAVVAMVGGLVLALPGCKDDKGLLSGNCDGTGACKVDVSVTSCSAQSTTLTINPDPLPVKKANNIFWELDQASTSLYRFRDGDGVVLKTPDSDFDGPEAQANNKKFKLHDKNSKATTGQELRYPYSINIQKLESGTWVDCKTFDPSIVNKG
jgi:hypothetical protein